MKPRLYNRQELVNREVKVIRESMFVPIDKAILFWFERQQVYDISGDSHGKQAASMMLQTLDYIKCEMQQV